MKRQVIVGVFFSLAVMCGSRASIADELLMARSAIPFAETMLILQDTIRKHGYTLSRVQRVDIGLTTFGYDTDKYRVVFFGKADELRTLSDRHPELIPYLPIKVAIFGEGEETLLVTASPARLSESFPDPDLKTVFNRWEKDLQSMFSEVRAAE